ncbi:MAG: LON peptidase substrate-binding domain-containing protein [Gammaproteobacteria bacterium]|nr:peptidase S16 [Rhodocyclaceae bacterium]MBU3908144.1 LON peptidase substrate-binding domain-containing protein [Gammaproteobacteria bacterium]MBU3989739.1 LON peptidase substrate-binding domain-containing protein [Gammaproteobacteria bacterium]MBU4005785.1 LON peptidase substrate-binding domain-containing protein [Gammaproteobacteria bacterium]MBU4021467.1 LON peptidase substrate-binding domain-containing protein [Gammaproteobacteria bacterium]
MSTPTDIPLFLLNTVLNSGGSISLRVFEPRYMDMVKDCLRAQTPFGVCLIEQGDEVITSPAPAVAATVPHLVGTLATIADWDMPQMGILNIVVHGGARFRILDHRMAMNGLIRAAIELLPAPLVTPIPGDYARLVPMLRALIEGLEEGKPPEPHHFYDAAWVADRWAELLPLPLNTRQQLLELDDGVARLEAIYRFLERS